MTGHTRVRDRRSAKYCRGSFDSCYLCDSEPTQLHHVSYRPEETIAVCSSCHASIHSNTPPDDSLVPDNPRPEEYEKSRRAEEREEKALDRFREKKPQSLLDEEVEKL